MSKASIIILTICTAILIAVFVFTLKPDPGVGEIYLTSSDKAAGISIEDKGGTDFNAVNSSIYLMIPVKDVKAGDTIGTNWLYYGKEGYKTMQEDTIAVEEDGSGEIAVYFLKRDDAYYPGDYKAIVEYNDSEKTEISFTVSLH
ncbi:MAG: hypothetical protein K8S14_05765 [Actinomycetia bacterium]|nr:hypothetical protein [Actinomycetes bacterium]